MFTVATTDFLIHAPKMFIDTIDEPDLIHGQKRPEV